MRRIVSAAVILVAWLVDTSAQTVSPVQVTMPVNAGLTERVALSGSLTALHDASLSSRTAGLVAHLFVDAGDTVSRGQPLIALDTALAEHELTQRQAARQAARVARDEAQRQLNEAERLAEQKLFPQTELDSRRGALAQAEARLAQSVAALRQQQEVVARHTLSAPFDGVIAARLTDIGEYVALGSPVMRLVAPSPLVLDVQVPQEHYPAMPRLGRIVVRADTEPQRDLVATLLAAVPVGDATARSFQARLLIEESGHLLPGTSASATLFFQGVNQSVYVVPPDALLQQADGQFSVFTVSDGKAFRHRVAVGRGNEDGIEILDGLPGGQPVVVRGNEILQDGQSVRITDGGN
ncbi:MAG: efflux RND transporter periplasmic adaptor subunit [Pseudomonadota bacterium]